MFEFRPAVVADVSAFCAKDAPLNTDELMLTFAASLDVSASFGGVAGLDGRDGSTELDTDNLVPAFNVILGGAPRLASGLDDRLP